VHRGVFRVLAAFAPGLVLVLTAATAAAAPPTCRGLDATIVGTSHGDTLHGTAGDDVIVSLGGDDQIFGGGGNDVVCAGAGDDLILPGGGDDQVDGADGTDTISYAGAPRPVSLILDPDGGQAIGVGDDRIFDVENAIGSSQPDSLTGGPGPSRLEGGPGDDSLNGAGGTDRLLGGGGLDNLDGGGRDDVLKGGHEDDFLVGGPGDDSLRGGGGLDIAGFPLAPGPVDASLATGQATGDGSDLISEMEGLVGSEFPDTLTGDDGELNVLLGGSGNDHLAGHDGFDYIAGGQGDDTVDGGDGTTDVAGFFDSPTRVQVDLSAGTATGYGDDTLTNIESVDGSTLNDLLHGDAGLDFFLGEAGDDRISGGPGPDFALYLFSPHRVNLDLETGVATGEGTDKLSSLVGAGGSQHSDQLLGDGQGNTFLGDRGNDLLDGRGGFDGLDGGPGTDTCLNGERVTTCEATTKARRRFTALETNLSKSRSLLHVQAGLRGTRSSFKEARP
jgi:Ca2+-binding RTX toxin-like protein